MPFLAYRLLISISLLSLLGCANALNSDVNFTSLCEEVRERILEEGIHNKSNNLGQLNCGAKFSEDTLPSLSIPISLTYCLARAAGYQRSRVLSEWATPLFGFMLPALIFTLTVKRRSQFVKYTRLLKTESSTEKSSSHYQRAKEVFWDIMILIWVLFISVISASVDAVVWAVTVFVLAGPLIAGTVHEAVLDFFMLQRLEQNITHLSAPRLGSSASSSESLVSNPNGYDPEAAMSGRFNSEAAPGDIVDRTLNDPIKKLRRLLKEAQPFGDIIVGPVVFFLGAFVWSLFDARERKGDNDTANAVAFGIWYGVVVLVATVFTATIGVTHHLTGEKVGPVDTESDDETGLKKAPTHRLIHNYLKKWKKNAIFIVAYHDAELSSYITDLQLWTSRVFALAAAVTFVIFPCMLASAICYWTPTVGFGCRTVTVVMYGISQLVLIAAWFIQTAWPIDTAARTGGLWFKSLWTAMITAILFGALSTVGGTIMQLVGVYRNCICKAGLRFLINHDKGVVELATDTAEDRNRSVIWWGNGIIALAFFAGILLLACMYEMWMKRKCKAITEKFENNPYSKE